MRLRPAAQLLGLMLSVVGPHPVTAVSPLASGRASAPVEDLPAFAQGVAIERRAFSLLETDPLAAQASFLEASARFAAAAEATSGDGLPFWRSARCRWFAGEVLPVDPGSERVVHFEAAQALAERGIEADADCAECMLWKFVAMGRVATSRSVIAGMRDASEMADLLDRGLALNPKHRDGDDNSTLGNLHYGSAIFYRVLPDWMWMRWLIGVRGDKERALGHARTALALHPARLDYRVELASQLLCLGSTDDQRERLDEGVSMLEQLLDAETHSVRDERQIVAAEIMLASPPKSCGYTGDTWVEIDEQDAAAVGASGKDGADGD